MSYSFFHKALCLDDFEKNLDIVFGHSNVSQVNLLARLLNLVAKSCTDIFFITLSVLQLHELVE